MKAPQDEYDTSSARPLKKQKRHGQEKSPSLSHGAGTGDNRSVADGNKKLDLRASKLLSGSALGEGLTGERDGDEALVNDAGELDAHLGRTKTASRIKLRSKTTPTPDHHIEHTEINNGKIVDADSSFATIDVVPWLIVSLGVMEIRRPTAIQRSCIPQILKGQDVIGASKTGSGKTVTFAVPIMQKWAEDPMGIFALVLTPTR